MLSFSPPPSPAYFPFAPSSYSSRLPAGPAVEAAPPPPPLAAAVAEAGVEGAVEARPVSPPISCPRSFARTRARGLPLAEGLTRALPCQEGSPLPLHYLRRRSRATPPNCGDVDSERGAAEVWGTSRVPRPPPTPPCPPPPPPPPAAPPLPTTALPSAAAAARLHFDGVAEVWGLSVMAAMRSDGAESAGAESEVRQICHSLAGTLPPHYPLTPAAAGSAAQARSTVPKPGAAVRHSPEGALRGRTEHLSGARFHRRVHVSLRVAGGGGSSLGARERVATADQVGPGHEAGKWQQRLKAKKKRIYEYMHSAIPLGSWKHEKRRIWRKAAKPKRAAEYYPLLC
eukprot:scaffold91879_cov63-Phaeocystis_antarctica.AAC.2